MKLTRSTSQRKNRTRAGRFFESLEGRQMLSTYYLSPSGNNSAAGSLAAPWQSLQYAVNSASAGDTLIMRGGNYAGHVTINKPNLTIQSYAGETASISSPNNDSSIFMTIDIDTGASGTTLRGLDISGGYWYAVKMENTSVDSGANHITIENSKLHDSGQDVIKIVGGNDDVTIRNNEIYNSGRRYASNAEGIDNVNGDRMLVQNNYFHDITTNGLYAKGGSIGSIIENNRFNNIGYGGILLGQDTDYDLFDTSVNPNRYENINGIVRNNIVTNTGASGIGLWAASGAQVYNNTLVNVAQTMQGGIYINSSPTSGAVTTNSTISNNIIQTSSGRPSLMIVDGGMTGALTMNNNRYYNTTGAASFDDERNGGFMGNLAAWQSHIGSDKTSTEGVTGLDANQHLLGTSTLIDKGQTISSVTKDIDGQARPSGAGYDIGADEYMSSGTTPPPVTPPPVTPPAATGTGLKGEYFVNPNLTGLRMTRTDATVNFNWGAGAPSSSMGVDNFSVRWTGQVMPKYTEQYTFYTTTDDGARLWVNGQQIINSWVDQGGTQRYGRINLQAGKKYDIKMEYYEHLGAASATLAWSSPSQVKQIIPQSQLFAPATTPVTPPAAGNGLTAQYFNDMTLTNLAGSRIDPTVNFNWGAGSPMTGVNADQFSARWTGKIVPLYSETYTFTTTTDDGVRLWVNGQLLVDHWSDQSATPFSGSIALVAGQKYDIKMEYYDNKFDAVSTLQWSSPSQAQQIVPQSQLYSA